MAGFCINCGSPLEEDGKFCWNCGTEQTQDLPVQPQAEAKQEEPAPVLKEKENTAQAEAYAGEEPEPPAKKKQLRLPKKYKPLSGWAYWGYNILFHIPVLGFIFLLIFSFNNKNINRRNFARSWWPVRFIGFLLVALIVFLFLRKIPELLNTLQGLMEQLALAGANLETLIQ